MNKCFSLLFSFTLFFSFGQLKQGDTYRVFYLGGQSNMDGYGSNEDLPDSLTSGLEDVWIFHGTSAADGVKTGGQGKWQQLSPGHGRGFWNNGKKNILSKSFGIELSFAKQMKKLFPNDKIALIKYSRGGTSIDSLGARKAGCWEPDVKGKEGINQYDHFLQTLEIAYSQYDINGDKRVDKLIPSGIVWMQGESDANVEEIAAKYYDHLKRLTDLMRAALRKDDLPLVLGKISDSGRSPAGKVWRYGDLVQYAQEKLALSDPNIAIVRNTKYYKYSDPWHYNSAGYIDLGKAFADALHKLIITFESN